MMKNKLWTISLIMMAIILLSGVVTLAMEAEIELNTDELVVDDLNSKVIATGNVIFKRDGLSLSCAKMIASGEDLEEIIASGEVVVERENERLTADKLVLNNKTETGVLTGNPRFESEDKLLSGERIEIDFANERVVIIDNAHLEDKEDDLVADADRIEYDKAKAEAILIGNVKARKGERKMTSKRVILDLENNKMRSTGRTKFVVPDKSND